MSQKAVFAHIPFAGYKKTRENTDPFFSSPGDLTEAQFGMYTLEGGFLQHGGIKLAAAAVSGTPKPIWMYRWYRGKSYATNPFLVLYDNGSLYIANSDPAAVSFTMVLGQDFSTGVGVNITGLSSTYFSVEDTAGWLFLAPEDAADSFYAFNGTQFFQVGAVPPVTSGGSPDFTPGFAGSTGGTLTPATYYFVFTYYFGPDKELGESNPSGEHSYTLVGPNNRIVISGLPAAAPRDDIGYIRIYRTLATGASGGPYYYVGEVQIGTTTINIDTGDAALAFANFELETDHDLPPTGARSVALHRDRLWLVQDDPPNRIIWSLVGQPYVYPTENYSDELFRQTREITTIFSLGPRLYCSTDTIWVLVGDQESNFYWENLQNTQGFIAEQSVRRADGVVLGLGTTDVLVFDGTNTSPLLNVRGVVEGILPTFRKNAFAVYRKKHYYLALQTEAALDPSLILLIRRDPTAGAEMGFSASILKTEYIPDSAHPEIYKTFRVSALSGWRDELNRIYIGKSDGKIYEFDRFYSISEDGEDTAGLEFKLKTSWFFPNGPYGWNIYNRWYVAIEDEGGGGDVEVSWEIMDDNLNSLREGSHVVSLTDESIPDVVVGRWNNTRWS